MKWVNELSYKEANTYSKLPNKTLDRCIKFSVHSVQGK